MALPKSYGIALGWPIGPGQAGAPVVIAPSNTVAPAISGTAQQGQLLTCSTGTWAGSLATYTYQWSWADTGAPISGATSSTYTLVSGDVGHTVRCQVTATNTAGAVATFSNTTTAVTSNAVAPVNSVAPAITGTAQQGQLLTCSTGTWSNTPTGYAYQWYWADTSAVISGATASTYTLLLGDVGHTILCAVTASNAAGNSSPANSNTTAAVSASGGATYTFDATNAGYSFDSTAFPSFDKAA